MKEPLKRLMRRALEDYQLNRVYRKDLPAHPPPAPTLPEPATIAPIVSRERFAQAAAPELLDHAWYLDTHAHAYGLYEGRELVSAAVFWVSGHPRMPGRFAWLGPGEAVMVDLLTAPGHRGKGYALALTRNAEADLPRQGYTRLWTWVWHNNTPSIRVFEKAGWRYSHFLVEIKSWGATDYLRLKLPPLAPFARRAAMR
jgi:GNAT superfamily N-acetyltransferase